MKVIRVYFKDVELGKLTFQNGNYCFQVSRSGVEKANKKGYPTFLYDCNESFVSDVLPESIKDLLSEEVLTSLEDLLEIVETDTEFDVLYKLAELDISKPDFHVEI